MVRSLAARRGLKRLRSASIYGCIGYVVLGMLLASLWPALTLPSLLLGLPIGAAMFAVSWWTTSLTLNSGEPSVIWVAADYGIKVALTLVALLVAKKVDVFEVGPVAVLIVVAIAASTAAQVIAFIPERRRAVPNELAE